MSARDIKLRRYTKQMKERMNTDTRGLKRGKTMKKVM
jgi:hypothetical protein